MGIYKQNYRKFEGKLHGRVNRVFTIFKNDFLRRIKNRWVMITIFLAWSVGVFPILTGAPFMAFFVLTFIWLLLFTAIAGGPIIAEDMQYNAITLFLSRPLQRVDYFFGKYLTLFSLISLISLLPNILIAVFIMGTFYGTSSGEMDYNRFSYTLVGIGILMTFVFTNIGLAFSALTKNHKFASGGIFAFLFFSNILSIALSNLYDKIMYCSIWANFMIIFSKWNGVSDNSFYDMDANVSIGILLLISIICILIVWIKVQRAELSE